MRGENEDVVVESRHGVTTVSQNIMTVRPS